MKQILHQSLNALEAEQHKQYVGAPPTELVARCIALRSKPLQEYTVEDLRLSIGQRIGLTWLVPLALAQLQLNLYAEGDYYPGDLLSSVSQLPDSYWQENPVNLNDFLHLLRAQLPSSPPADMPASVYREVQHRLTSLTSLKP